MKPFDLKEAAKSTKQVVTREGKLAKIVYISQNENYEYPVMCEVEGEKRFCSYTKEGKFMKEGEHHLDLFIKDNTITKYAAIYRSSYDSDEVIIGSLHDNYNDASIMQKYRDDYMATAKVTITY